MEFNLTKPCNDCPFLKRGGIRLTRGRIKELATAALDFGGASFSCHKTVQYESSDEDEAEAGTTVENSGSYCAGSLIFSEKHGAANQSMRIAERLGFYDHHKLNRGAFPLVFDTLAQWLRTAIR